MLFRRLASNLRLSSGAAGALAEYTLDPHPGGHTAKRAGFQVVIKQKSTDAVKVGIRLLTGPDGKTFLLHSTPIASTTVGSGILMLEGESNSAKMLGEWLQVGATCEGNGNIEWAVVDIYEILTPF